MESNVCKKPALAGVCAAQRQIFGPLRGPKIETLGRLSEKSMDFFDSLGGAGSRAAFLCFPYLDVFEITERIRWHRRYHFSICSRICCRRRN